MARLSLKGVKKRFKETEVLHGIDLEIGDREFVVFVGPSGCGKSTLLRLIAGLDPITEGSFRLNEKLMNTVPPSKRGISMVFQSYALYPHMDVYENMAFGIRLMGLDKPEIDKRIGEAAKMLQLEPLLKRKPRELSGGQRQRVAIARALVRKPQVFLLDEPLSNLDAALRSEVRLEIAKLHQDIGGTMIYVTHDQIEAMTLADKIVVMNEGRIEQVGTPHELYESPANTFVATFIGSPKMTLLEARTANGKLSIPNGGSVTGSAPDGAGETVTVGMRPDALDIAEGDAPEGFGADVVYTEYLGNDAYVYARLADGTLVSVRAAPKTYYPANARITVMPRAEALHYFDSASGARL
ncbi:ABC transporter ATP-binding protein [Pelagibacterium xiamenense]|uniref:ABC transporter ATP-binding protein n=1 Tax=Pelagibacterium xiamenense TaxID=2901140 RepID=UPI001E47B2C6|nr:sn-glycerol-3-phosphate ABC transporter ATP-binding protein UgpC [Pelagibacterium xiamenense]MCD7061368.1 sn-glycerol-3-phosphate ABC transporter ATP-binding protein UgpC [Pelagibacterium xiamenense]